MARGKYAVRAESRDWDQMQKRIATLEKQLEHKGKLLKEALVENMRLRALEKIFDGTVDVIAELEKTRKELDDLHGRNFVLQIRIDRWGKMLAKESNQEFLRLTPDLWADLAELGYFRPTSDDNRGSRRAFKTSAKLKKTMDIGRNGGKVVVGG